MNVKRPKYEVIYNSADITEDISRFLIGLTYTDCVQGKSDGLDIELEDTDFLWQNDWFPAKGDTLEVRIGYDNLLVPCGLFEIDEVEASGPPDSLSVRALAAGITKALRTKSNAAYEGQTLRRIAQQVAARTGLSVTGEIEAVTIERATQHRETDLRFLHRISKEYGHVFSVRAGQLIFSRIYDLEEGSPVTSLSRTDLTSYELRDKTASTFARSRVRYHDPRTQEVVESTAEAEGVETGADTLAKWVKAESQQQADEIARSILHNANTKTAEGKIVVEGNPYLLAGSNVELVGLGALSGVYHIEESQHSINPLGYSTSCQIKRVGTVPQDLWRSTRNQSFNLQ